jgi:hypothetical protein
MIATSRRSASNPAISRQYEFSRLQDQTLASAYEALVPVVSRSLERLQVSGHPAELAPTKKTFQQPSAAGA